MQLHEHRQPIDCSHGILQCDGCPPGRSCTHCRKKGAKCEFPAIRPTNVRDPAYGTVPFLSQTLRSKLTSTVNATGRDLGDGSAMNGQNLGYVVCDDIAQMVYKYLTLRFRTSSGYRLNFQQCTLSSAITSLREMTPLKRIIGPLLLETCDSAQ